MQATSERELESETVEALTQKYPVFTGQGPSDDNPSSSPGPYNANINEEAGYPKVNLTTSDPPAWPSPSPWLSSGNHGSAPTLPPPPRNELPKQHRDSPRASPKKTRSNTGGESVFPKVSFTSGGTKWQRPSWLHSRHHESPETMLTFHQAFDSGPHLSQRRLQNFHNAIA